MMKYTVETENLVRGVNVLKKILLRNSYKKLLENRQKSPLRTARVSVNVLVKLNKMVRSLSRLVFRVSLDNIRRHISTTSQ